MDFLPRNKAMHLPFKKSATEKNHPICACAHPQSSRPRDLYAMFISTYIYNVQRKQCLSNLENVG